MICWLLFPVLFADPSEARLPLFVFQAAEQQSTEEDVSTLCRSQHSSCSPLPFALWFCLCFHTFATVCMQIPAVSSEEHDKPRLVFTCVISDVVDTLALQWKGRSRLLRFHAFILSGLCQGQIWCVSDAPVPTKTGLVWRLTFLLIRLIVTNKSTTQINRGNEECGVVKSGAFSFVFSLILCSALLSISC